MAERRVTVKVDLQAGGNLAQVAGAAAAQVAKVQAATKGAAAAASSAGAAASASAGYGGFGNYLPPTQAAVPGSAWAAGANANVLKRAIPVAQFAPPTARYWTEQDTLREAGQKRIGDAEQRLAYLRSGPGQAATIRALQAETALSRQQDNLARVAKLGIAGAALDRFAERAEPVARGLRNIGLAGDALMYASIASVSPVASSQITNSFRMIANEIGIAVIPSAVRFTGALQQVARAVRTTNDATGGWAGTLAFTGIGLATAAGVAGMAVSTVRNIHHGLRAAGILGEAGAAVAGQVVGNLAGQAVRGGAGQAAQPATTATAGGVGGFLARSGPLLPVAAIAAAVVDAGVSAYGAVQDARAGRGPAYDPGASSFAQGRQRAEQFTSWIPAWSIAVNQFNAVANAFSSERNQVPTHGLGGWSAETLLGFFGQGPQAAATADVSEREPRFFASAVEVERAMTARIQQQPGPLGEQEARAMSEFANAMRSATPALVAIGQAGNQGANWGPALEDNG